MNDLYRNAEEVTSGFAFDEDILKRALMRIYDKSFHPMTDIERNLFNAIWESMNAAVDEGFGDMESSDHDYDFMQELKTNNAVFAAFKVHRTQRDMARLLTDSNGNLKPFEEWVKEVMPIADHQMRHWLKTEYDTAVIRAHHAADWKQFLREKDVFPNLKWVESTSINPGADHRVFWNTILPIEHPFWIEHRPGDRWNCKCDLVSTDEEPTDIPETVSIADEPQMGLKSNPGQDGIIFSDNHPYFPNNCNGCAFYKPTITDRMKTIFTNKAKDCYHCKYIKRCIDNIQKEDIVKANRVEYHRLKENGDYTDVVFDKKKGGLKATHIGHITHNTPKAERFFEGLTSSDLERECQDQLFQMGHKVLLCDESLKRNGNYLPALDMSLDDEIMDIRSVTGHGWYSNIFVKKNDQLRRYNARTDIARPSEALCLYFHDPSLFNESKMIKSINFFRFFRDNKGNLIDKQLKKVVCVIKGQSKILTFYI